MVTSTDPALDAVISREFPWIAPSEKMLPAELADNLLSLT
jgi:hypothetical protein